jgi:CBS domain-containing protein
MKVQHIMTTPVIRVRADTTVEEIARLLTTYRIGAVPVVDDEDHVIGIVSESDLFLKEKGIPFSAVKLPALFKQWVEPSRLAEIYESARHHTAADIMTTDVVCVNVKDDIGHVAWLMAQRDLKRVPVLRGGKLVGIITRTDLIRLLVKAERSQK